jgi:integrase/recombinase XerD
MSHTRGAPYARMSLYAPGGRKYLNVAERRRFLLAARRAPPRTRLFCLVLMWSGGRISEALALNPLAFDLDEHVVTIETLKRRKRGVLRHVPLPPILLRDLDRVFRIRQRQRDATLATVRLWSWSRCTAWRNVKRIMTQANVIRSAAMPKGLRHGFGVAAFQTVPPHLVQRWLGHASLRTTGIYGEVVGREERDLAKKLWRRW